VYYKTASSFAEDAIGREANELKKLSDRYRNADTPERRNEAKALEKAAFILSSGGTLDCRSHEVVRGRHPEGADVGFEKEKKHENPSFEVHQQAVSISQEVPRDAIADKFVDLVLETRAKAKNHSERKLNPQRRMTEKELREHLVIEERKLTERQQRVEAEQEKIQNPRSIDTDVMSPIPTDHGAQSGSEQERSSQRNADTDTQGQTQPERRLTEAELREVLNRGVRKLNEAEKKRQRDAPGKSKDSGIDFGFD
jgi:hypothetical protein